MNLHRILRGVAFVLLFLLVFGIIKSSPAYTQTVFSCNDVTEIPLLECQALEALYQTADGDNWIDNSGWLVTNTPCSWFGVSCSTGQVTSLSLRANQLSGTMPAELGNLANLKALNLGINDLNGILPPELGNLTNLEAITLDYNQLSGTIPTELGNLANLQFLTLSDVPR